MANHSSGRSQPNHHLHEGWMHQDVRSWLSPRVIITCHFYDHSFRRETRILVSYGESMGHQQSLRDYWQLVVAGGAIVVFLSGVATNMYNASINNFLVILVQAILIKLIRSYRKIGKQEGDFGEKKTENRYNKRIKRAKENERIKNLKFIIFMHEQVKEQNNFKVK